VLNGVGHELGDDQSAVVGQVVQTPDGQRDTH
jgi:hypothetical protein